MPKFTSFSVCLLLLCCIMGCSEESAAEDPTSSTDTASTHDASDSGASGADSGGDAAATCGNGQVEAGEECDDGPDNSDERSDACRTNCKNASCGDGVVDDEGLSEACDDGNQIDDDGCNNLCRLPSCGDGALQTGEQCDDGPQNSDTLPDACRTNCRSARCGDGTTDTGEACDDANSSNSDACLNCVISTCGDGFIRQSVEACDDGNNASQDGCSDQCLREQGFDCQGEPSVCSAVCGDGVISTLEACDDANNVGGDYCAADCSAITGRCGDNIRQSNETCDDGNLIAGDYCSPTCIASGSCGDAIVQALAGEACDDGNTANNDGCLGSCSSTEPGWSCSGTPTNCTAIVCVEHQHVQNNTCTSCPPGSTNIAGDSASGPNTLCDPTLCADNERVQNHICVSCPLATNNPAGDDASGPDTLCDPILCAENQRVQSNACVGCDPGTINPAGDNASGPDTTCEIHFCDADQHVQNNDCVTCPPGSTNTPGDDATGPNTTCDITFCSVNQHVQSNACVDCPFGSVNEAGDDATASDTFCDPEHCYAILGVVCSDFEQAYIKDGFASVSRRFGHAVALSGDTLAVGVYSDDSDLIGVHSTQFQPTGSTNSGAVHIFVRSGTTWTRQAYIKASNTDSNDQFGYAVALDGDTLAVGAQREDSVATGINGDQADNSAIESGAVYIFVRSGTTWTQQAYIKASNTEAGDQFGGVVALSGDTLAVGVDLEDSFAVGIDGNQADNSAADSGAVYVFARSGVAWTQQAYIKASNSEATDRFGQAVALSGDNLAVAAQGEDSNATTINGDQSNNSALGSGAAFVFTRSGTTWTQQAYIKASNTGSNDIFGSSVALDGDTLAVGALGEDSNATGVNGNQADNSMSGSGAVYVFARSGTAWAQEAYIKASNANAGDLFGRTLALNGDTLAVGADQEDSNATGINGDQANNSAQLSGAVYLFTRSGITWAQQAYIKASNTEASDFFSSSVALSGNTLAVGAIYEDSNATNINGDQTDNATSECGAVYVRKIKP